ncbi:MAG: phage tail sheath family protein [Thermoclostridium sp.]|nr:phage tail sheath family protein [Thermoclostridium sp.]
MKDSVFNPDSLTGWLGKQRTAEVSKSEQQNKNVFFKASPTPAFFPEDDPEPSLPTVFGRETDKTTEPVEAGKEETQPGSLVEGLTEPKTSSESTISIPEDSSYTVPGVYVEEIQSIQPIQGVLTDITAFVGITETKPAGNEPPLLNGFLEYQQYYGGFLPESMGQYGVLPHAVKSFFENGGTRCYIISITPVDINHIVSDDFLDTGLSALEQLKDVRIVAIPGVFNVDIQQGFIDHCEAMKDRFAILDMPDTIEDVSDLHEHREHFDSSYAAFYHPWLQTQDTEKGETRYIPPSGAIAGIYGANDKTRGVHKAPANIPVSGIIGLKYTVTENEQEDLNPDGINAIRFFPGRGTLVWGARTCSSDEEYKYVNVKRYVLYLNQSIREGTEWTIYEPNNEQLWARTVQSVENFLNSEWRNGALMGTKPEQAYFVKMDRTTMTVNDLEQEKRILIFGVATTKPAEFIVVSILHNENP